MAYPGIVQHTNVYRLDTNEKMSNVSGGGQYHTNLPDNTLVEITTASFGYHINYMRPCGATLDSLRNEDGYFEGKISFVVNDEGKANRRGNIVFNFLKLFNKGLMFAIRGNDIHIDRMPEQLLKKASEVSFSIGALHNDQDFENGSKVKFKKLFYTNRLEAADIELMP